MAEIVVCPASRLDQTIKTTGARQLISLVSPDTDLPDLKQFAPGDHLLLRFNDIVKSTTGLVEPGTHHIQQLIEFGRSWNRKQPLLIHCYAGISRSPAAAYIIALSLDPAGSETGLARQLRRLSVAATPNIRMVEIGDKILGRQGRMIRAVKAIGRGQQAFEGLSFSLSVGNDMPVQ